MNGEVERLSSALAGRYQIKSELGSGGMAHVFLAVDERHGRDVAVKVMRDEVGATLGRDRFLREIEVAASLSHPNIVPLYDSGEADGFLFYVMPVIEGDTLRARLQRETQLPVDTALDITRQVAAALQHAHDQDIVHRDIKPENVMLSEDHAVVTDFGIARALSKVGVETLTRTGVALGSPYYMSPEQANADANVDWRSDQYSLASVLFEMLAGEPPYSGRTMQAFIARQAVESVPSISTLRDTVPPSVEAAVTRALAKAPADRFSTVTDFVEAFDSPVSIPARRRRLNRVQKFLLYTSAALVVVVLGWLGVANLSNSSGRLATAGIGAADGPLMVLPFTVAGSQPNLSREALARLLTDAISGQGGLPVVPTDSVLAGLGTSQASDPTSLRAGLSIAPSLGAAALLQSNLIATDNGWQLTTKKLALPSGSELYRIENLSAPRDSLTELIEAVARRLLIRESGEQRRVRTLASVDLTALKAYLYGVARYRRGHYKDAIGHLERAVGIDSTFSLAALHLAVVADPADDLGAAYRGSSLAWASKDRLDESDQRYLMGLAGSSYPRPSTLREDLRQWEWMVDSIPSRWEAAYELGSVLFRWGSELGLDAPLRRSAAAFERTLDIDPRFAPSLELLIDLQFSMRDSMAFNRLSNLYFSEDTTQDRAPFIRWLGLTYPPAFGDSAASALLGTMEEDMLRLVMWHSQLNGSAVSHAVAAAEAISERAVNQVDLWLATLDGRVLALNMGQPGHATALVAASPLTLPVDPLFRVVEAIYWDGDTALAATAVRERAPFAALPPPFAEENDGRVALEDVPVVPAPDIPLEGVRLDYFMDVCTVGLWRLHEGEYESALEMASKLSAARDPRSLSRASFILFCRHILEAEALAALDRSEAGQRANELDALLLEGLVSNPFIMLAAKISLSGIRERAGDIEGALAVVRRRSRDYAGWGVVGLSTLLREEARLAELAGDAPGALQAYRHYLALRDDPEPLLLPEVHRARAAVASLEGTVSR